MSKTINAFKPDYIIPPGETLLELLDYNNMTQLELAKRIGMASKTVNEIVKGKASITHETAEKLEYVFGLEASFWNNLESNYREQLAEHENQLELEKQIGELKQWPIKELVKVGWIDDISQDEPYEKVNKLLRFFGVTSFENLRELISDTNILEGAYRIAATQEINENALICWIRKGEIEANQINTADFSKEIAKGKIDELRQLTLVTDSNVFIPKIQEICAEFGVAVVIVPEVKGSKVSGITRWLSPKPKAIIQLSLRYKTHDTLWFTFFHELGHILLHRKSKPFIELMGKDYLDSKEEQEANDFASNVLIPQAAYQLFIESDRYRSKEGIRSFAEEIGIHPGIVAGRLQKEKLVDYSWYRDLKVYYQWK